ncbi:MAG: 7-carboxy-7-deazaguanine synthase [Myxococcales bacterium]|nr:7-carboxy-7-deazaguanine synthase [Myxococcales bacterium]
MTYAVKEIFYTLQGEGAHAGRPAVFCRFAGCNLWNGREQDRAKAVCQFCDTDFVGVDGPGGGRFQDATSLATTVATLWPLDRDGKPLGRPYVVCTGGEPLLQLDAALIEAFHAQGFEIAIETNGIIEAPEGIDWICVSPKADASLKQRKGNELKLVYPQKLAPPDAFVELDFQNFFLQPMDGPERQQNTQAVLAYCLKDPRWRLSLQTHKILDIP